jgi:signal transduction histidine kinase
MVNELLDLARIEARQGKDLKREAVALGPLVQETIARIPQGAAARCFDLTLEHDGARLWVDPVKTGQALLNVLSNADKYSPGTTPIRIVTLDGTLDGTPAVAAAIGLRVTDQGIGMSPDQLARVFERFYRADPSGNTPGTGLGMSLVKEIVELQGGRVEVHSTLGAPCSTSSRWPTAGCSRKRSTAPRPWPTCSRCGWTWKPRAEEKGWISALRSDHPQRRGR